MSFKNENFERRLQTMGDIAERKFEEVSPVNYVRFGLNRPPLRMSSLPPLIRYTPDYLTSECFVEVQGFGQDQTLKLKLDKMDALRKWAKEHPVKLFVYDSHKDRHAYIELNELNKMCKQAKVDSFPEGKEYYAIQSEVIWLNEQAGNTA